MSDDLLNDIEQYLVKTNSAPSIIARMAVGDPRAIVEMRKGRQVGPKTISKWREFIKDHPDGMPRKLSQGQSDWDNAPKIGEDATQAPFNGAFVKEMDALKTAASSGAALAPHMPENQPNREPCPRCGVRGELGCEHRKPFAAPPRLVTAIKVKM